MSTLEQIHGLTIEEVPEYIEKFCKLLLTKLRDALPECCDVIPDETNVIVYPKNHDPTQEEMRWITIRSWEKDSKRPAGYFVWCYNLPISHVSKIDWSALDSPAKRNQILATARKTLKECLEVYPMIDLDESAIFETDMNGWFRHEGGQGWASNRRISTNDIMIQNSEQIVFSPEEIWVRYIRKPGNTGNEKVVAK